MPNMVTTLQTFVEAATVAMQKLSPEQKAEFRQAWRDQVADRVKENDRLFLLSVGIDPNGD
jgi:hypothetical protein